MHRPSIKDQATYIRKAFGMGRDYDVERRGRVDQSPLTGPVEAVLPALAHLDPSVGSKCGTGCQDDG